MITTLLKSYGIVSTFFVLFHKKASFGMVKGDFLAIKIYLKEVEEK